MAASTVQRAPIFATVVISMARQWLKERTDANIEEIISSTNISHANNISNKGNKHKLISNQLTKQLEEVKYAVNTSTNNDYESAKTWFIKALRWRHNETKFSQYINSSYHKCNKAKSTINKSINKIHLYSLLIASGFIYHSKYGQNQMDGLRYIYNILIDINNDKKIQKSLAAALESKLYGNEEAKQLLKSVILFSIRMRSFIKDIQQSIAVANTLKLVNNVSPISISSLSTLSLLSNHDQTLMSDGWIPSFETGYYFGNISCINYRNKEDIDVNRTNQGYKYPILGASGFRNIFNLSKSIKKMRIDDYNLYLPYIEVRISGQLLMKKEQYIYTYLDWEPTKSLLEYEKEIGSKFWNLVHVNCQNTNKGSAGYLLLINSVDLAFQLRLNDKHVLEEEIVPFIELDCWIKVGSKWIANGGKWFINMVHDKEYDQFGWVTQEFTPSINLKGELPVIFPQ